MEHKLAWTMTLFNQLLRSLFQQTQEDITAFTKAVGGFEDSDQLLVQYAYAVSPEPLGLAHIFKRVPYTNPHVLRNHLQGAVERGWLISEKEGAYKLAEKGEGYVNDLMMQAEAQYALIVSRAELSEDMMNHVVDLLSLVDEAIEEQEAVTEKYAWTMAHLFDNESACLLAQLRRRMIYLLSYRDDAHVRAWSTHALDGHVWEAFSRVWEGQAKTASELAEQLPYRNFDEAAYQKALDILVKRRWMDLTDEGYILTGKGVALREDVEVLTDRYYDAAFEVLSVHDLVELEGLLESLVEALTLEPVVV